MNIIIEPSVFFLTGTSGSKFDDPQFLVGL